MPARDSRAGREYSKRTAFGLLASLIAPYGGRTLLTAAMLLCDVVGMLYVPTELSALINVAMATGDASQVAPHALRMLAASVVGSGGCIVSYYLASQLAADIGRDLRIAVYEKSLALSGADFVRFGTGSMITRTLSDANVVQQTLLMCFTMMFPVPVICVVSVVLAWGIDPLMGQVLVALSLVLTVISAVAVALSAPIFLRLQEFIDRMNARLRETITGVRVIRAFGKEAQERRRLEDTFEDYARNAIRVNMIFSIADCSTFFLMNIVEVLLMWLGADRVGVHAMQIGSISALIEYAMLLMFFMMMAQFAMLQVPRALACLTRAAEVLGTQAAIADPEAPVRLLPAGTATDGNPVSSAATAGSAPDPAHDVPAGPVVRFDHVSLRFAAADEDTLHDLNFDLRRGETCAIVGNTGSGKSTVARLLLRFHDVTNGTLAFGGVDLRDLTQEDLRSHIAYVPQKAWLFSGTIASNLRDGAPGATDEGLWRALDVAQATFVRELPEGLGTRVAQGGSNFSGGQRQRLAIARALVRRADLYVFDDSFSALDYKTDAALRHALAGELTDAAVLIIAQRVSTIRDAAQIVVLKEGRIVGLGDHAELLDDCPTYRDIYESQVKGGGARA